MAHIFKKIYENFLIPVYENALVLPVDERHSFSRTFILLFWQECMSTLYKLHMQSYTNQWQRMIACKVQKTCNAIFEKELHKRKMKVLEKLCPIDRKLKMCVCAVFQDRPHEYVKKWCLTAYGTYTLKRYWSNFSNISNLFTSGPYHWCWHIMATEACTVGTSGW